MLPYPELDEAAISEHHWRQAPHMVKGLVDLAELVLSRCPNEPKMLVEVGCAAGESTWIWRHFFDQILCIDNWDYQGFEDNDAVGPRIEEKFDFMTRCDAGGTNGSVIKLKGNLIEYSCRDFGKVPLFYIDADHSYHNVVRDIRIYYNKSTRFFAGHDYQRGPHDQVVKAVNDMFGGPDYVFSDTSWLIDLDRGGLYDV